VFFSSLNFTPTHRDISIFTSWADNLEIRVQQATQVVEAGVEVEEVEVVVEAVVMMALLAGALLRMEVPETREATEEGEVVVVAEEEEEKNEKDEQDEDE